MTTWTLFMFLSTGSALTSQMIGGFESAQACEVARAQYSAMPLGTATYTNRQSVCLETRQTWIKR